jgi:uncharacterized protein YlxW (UPF0749 family)
MADNKETTDNKDSFPVTDIKTALDDINARAAQRKQARSEYNKKLNDAKAQRRNSSKSNQQETKLYGLASFSGTTGREQ